MAQPETGRSRTLSDDEEITIPSQDHADVRNMEIRYEQSDNTQQEDWLLLTEPMLGARPRQTGGLRAPAIEDPVLRDAAEVSAVRHSNGTLRLSPGRRIFKEEEVFTPPRGGGHPVPEPHGVQSEAQAVPRTFPEDTVRDGGKGQRNFRSPVKMLVNTVSGCEGIWRYWTDSPTTVNSGQIYSWLQQL